MRPLALLAAALVLTACDSTESPVSVPASAEAVTLVGLGAEFGEFGLVFDYVGRTPSPCHTYIGYGTSTRPPQDGEVQRIEVGVSVVSEADVCAGSVGTVERELFVRVPGPGLYDVVFERVYDEPLELRVRVRTDAVDVVE